MWIQRTGCLQFNRKDTTELGVRMADLYVHLRMRECCRNTLKDLDQRKKKAKFRSGLLATPSLYDTLGDKPIDEARKALPAGATGPEGVSGEGELERIARTTCEKICEKHAEKHEGAGEATEGRFWRNMALALTDKLPVQAQQFGAPGTSNAPEKAKALKEAADAALNKHPKSCSHSTAAVAEALGHSELTGLNANEQVNYMEKHWKTVDAATSQSMANHGELVVAGLKDTGNGHTAVVVPGDGATKMNNNQPSFYPNVQGSSLNGPGSAGYSNGSKTAGDVWNKTDRQNVNYYAPP